MERVIELAQQMRAIEQSHKPCRKLLAGHMYYMCYYQQVSTGTSFLADVSWIRSDEFTPFLYVPLGRQFLSLFLPFGNTDNLKMFFFIIQSNIFHLFLNFYSFLLFLLLYAFFSASLPSSLLSFSPSSLSCDSYTPNLLRRCSLFLLPI